MNCSVRTEADEFLAELVHDLRQPLTTLEYSASYLQMLLGDPQGAVQQQLQVIQEQLDVAARLVNEAAARVPRRAIQPTVAGDSLDLTKSQTAAVT